MSLTPSNMLPLGTKMPSFNLLNTIDGEQYDSAGLNGSKAIVVMFICNHCPFVIHVNEALVQLAKDYESKGVAFIAISSNDIVKYPQDGPDLMKKHASSVGYPFPYLFDDSQSVAKAFDAACTPDFYVFDEKFELSYRGQMDDSRPGNGKVNNGQDIRLAIEATLESKETPEPHYPSAGCNIKWK